MSDVKRVLGPGAKCCGGNCSLCAPAEPVEQDPDPFDWGTPPQVDPTD
jgi:hypothetical protein